jgi:uncharacterized protein YegL
MAVNNVHAETIQVKRPGGEMATRPLHFFFIADCSGSMAGEKIESLNTAVRDVIPHMQRVADENPHAQIFVRVLKFSDGAQWHVSQPTPIENFSWQDLEADPAGTDLGKALTMIADQLKMPPMSDRALPPVLVLITDGQATDDVNAGLKSLLAQPWGKKAVKIAIAIGDDASLSELQKFMNNPELKPLQANNPEKLVKYIKWASTAVLKAASSPASQSLNGAEDKRVNVPIPLPPDDPEDEIEQTDMW